METKLFRLAAGCTILGLMGAATVVAAPQTQEAPASSEAPSGPPTVLLLSDGKILQGEISQVGPNYVVKHKIGTILKPRREAVGAFRSIEEVYRYKVSILPESDGDERLKLAYWCLDQKLQPQARTQLEAVLASNPDDRRAKALLNSFDRKVAVADPRADPEIVRTSAEATDAALPSDQPLNRLRDEFARNPRGAGMPVVLDLPTPLAVVRYQEFSRTVHPILQKQCARCHNEQSQQDFQLVQARAKRDYGNDLLVRSNLDATLRLVNSDDLARSPLLSAAGMTHGNGGRPVLGGPNNPEYKLLAAWVNKLRVVTPPATASSPRSGGTPSGETFASGRLGSDPAMPPMSPDRPKTPPTFEPPTSGGAVSTPPSSDDFPLPPLQGGSLPPTGARGGKTAEAPAPDSADGVVTTSASGARIKTMPDGTALVEVNGQFVPYVTQDAKTQGGTARKKSKIDPKALQGLLSPGRGGK